MRNPISEAIYWILLHILPIITCFHVLHLVLWGGLKKDKGGHGVVETYISMEAETADILLNQCYMIKLRCLNACFISFYAKPKLVLGDSRQLTVHHIHI